MKRALLPVIVGAAMLSTAANAAVLVSTEDATRPYSGPTPTYDFDSAPAPVVGGIVTSTEVQGRIRPTGSTGNFLAAGPNNGGAATLDISMFGPVAQLSFLWGSMDFANTFELLDAANNVLFSINGQAVKDLGAVPPANVNRIVTFKITDAATQAAAVAARFSSSSDSFELDNVAIQAVPEPATWMMMILGMLGVGFAMRRRPAEPAMRIRFS